jgi:hypothetical protein
VIGVGGNADLRINSISMGARARARPLAIIGAKRRRRRKPLSKRFAKNLMMLAVTISQDPCGLDHRTEKRQKNTDVPEEF